MRTGIGLDVHAFGGTPPVLLCGVPADELRGLGGTSDADVAAHAVCDALLGAAALGDMGTHFPSSDDAYHGADSMELLAQVVAMVKGAALHIDHVDLTVISQSVLVGPHREEMRRNLAGALGVEVGAVSVKATTTDGLGAIGRDEGVAALAVASLS